METIVKLLKDNPDKLVKISFILNPVFDFCRVQKGSIFLPTAVKVLYYLLYYTPDNSMPHLYYLLNNLLTLFSGKTLINPYDNTTLDQIFSSIANFIKKYKGETLENLPWILETVFSLLKGPRRDAVRGCKILILILENYKFALDSYLPKILSEISATFAIHSRRLKICCSRAISLELGNSTLLTLSTEPLASSMLQFSLANIANYSDVIDKSHMIYGFGSLFWVIPELPQHVFNMLPAIFKAILELCKETHDYSSPCDEEIFDDQSIPVNHDAEYQEISEGSCSSESHDDAEMYFSFKNYGKVLYDSPFLKIDQNKIIKDIAQNLGWSFPEIMISIKRLLTKNGGAFIDSLIQ